MKVFPVITFIQAHILSITMAYTVDKNYKVVRVITAVMQRNTDNKFPISIRKYYSNRITISGEQITVIFSYFAYSSA